MKSLKNKKVVEIAGVVLKQSLKKLPSIKNVSKKVKPVSKNRNSIDPTPSGSLKKQIDLITNNLDTAKSAMPSNLKPMLAGIIDEAFNKGDWQFEIKWDGYRSLTYLQKGNVQLRSRNNLSFNEKYKPVYEALKAWPINAVIDGEIVVLNEEGHADFEGLQKWYQFEQGTLVYFVFDILWLEGHNLMELTLTERRDILKQLVPSNYIIRYSDSIDEYGIDFFKVAQQNGLEGIIAKQKNATYSPGYRTKSWLKIKAETRHEAVICGYTKNKDTDRLFSSLVLGIAEGEKVKFIGQVGTGFTGASQKNIFEKLKPLFTDDCPFEKIPKTGVPTFWVKPHLVCEVKYTELTSEGLMRHPSFQGLRKDKTIADLNLEEKKAVATKQIDEPVSSSKKKLPQKTPRRKLRQKQL